MNPTKFTAYHYGTKFFTLTRANCLYKKSACFHHCLIRKLYFIPVNGVYCYSTNFKKRFSKQSSYKIKPQTCAYSNSVSKTVTIIDSKEINFETDTLFSSEENIIEKKQTNNILYTLDKKETYKRLLNNGPGLSNFMSKTKNVDKVVSEKIPYLKNPNGNQQAVYLETYGCQMNVNDTEVVASILKQNNYKITNNMMNANIILIITCAIRDKAEQKIWTKLKSLRKLKQSKVNLKIGILGCMAERLKHKIVEEEKIVDIVAGPDSYKDLPRLLALSNEHETAINVTLSLDETYADVTPVRLNPDSKTAYVSIMRGCDNMCTYCIVPFTRGKERSRPIHSILDEVRILSDQGFKEVTLLGQNVNSYRDISEINFAESKNNNTNLAKGFNTVYKSKKGGLRFSDLLDKVSLVNPEMRIRFTSPHPKDFPDEVLQLIAERPNICKHIHLPAQSGNSGVLNRMRRGYTREAYLNLVNHIRSLIPNISLSSDFIVGFCDETDAEFNDTLTLFKEVKYNFAYLFAYSMREKTTAHRRYTDNIEKHIKLGRLKLLNDLHRIEAEIINKSQIGQQQLVLVEGKSKRSLKDLQGRNDRNTKVIFPDEIIPASTSMLTHKPISNGDYVVVHICNANSQILKGIPLYHSSIRAFNFSVNHNF